MSRYIAPVIFDKLPIRRTKARAKQSTPDINQALSDDAKDAVWLTRCLCKRLGNGNFCKLVGIKPGSSVQVLRWGFYKDKNYQLLGDILTEKAKVSLEPILASQEFIAYSRWQSSGRFLTDDPTKQPFNFPTLPIELLQFEAWYSSRYSKNPRFNGNVYTNPTLQGMWESWQASAQLRGANNA